MKRRVVNIDEDTYSLLQEYCNVHNLKINGFVESLINRGVKTMTADIARQQTQEYWKRKEADLEVDKTYLESILKNIDECSIDGVSHIESHNFPIDKQKSIGLCLKNRGFKVAFVEDSWTKNAIMMMIDW